MLVTLLGVLALGAWGAFAVFAASSGPSVSAFTLNASSPTNASSVSWKVVFSSAVTGVAVSNFSLVQGGGVSGAGSLAVTGGGTTYTVSANTGSGSGTLGLNLSSAGSIKDSSNKALQGTPYTGPVYTFDRAAPTAAITFPADGGSYNVAGYNAGCSPAGICGTASDGSAVTSVRVSVKGPNGKYWSAGSFSSTPEVFNAATGTTSWKYALAAGSDGAYVVDVQATDSLGNQQTGTTYAASSSFTLDVTPPAAPTITSGPAGTSNPPSATFSFSDTEGGVVYLCKLDSGSYTACTNPATFSGLSTGSHTLSVEAKDAAGNISASAASRTWTVDATPPPKPGIVGPDNKQDTTAATFTFSDSEAGITYQCNLDGGTYTACPNPKTFTLLTPGTHEVDVRAVDAAGNVSDINGWKWSINGVAGGGLPFAISGNADGALYPGSAAVYMNLSLTNPNSVTIYVTSLTVALSISATHSGPNPCTPSDFDVTHLQYTGGYPIVLPPGTKTLSQLGYTQFQQPSIRMLDRPLNQDACKGATLNFTYTGSAQS